MGTKNATLFTAAVMLFLFVSPVFATTDPGSLEKAAVTAHTFSYSTDYNIMAISGDGKKVGLADTYSGKVAISDVGGTSETVLVSGGGEYALGMTNALALNDDGSVMVLNCSTTSDGPGYLYISTATASVTFRAIGNYVDHAPCIDFDQGYYTTTFYYFDYSEKVYSICRYALESGTLLESIEIGKVYAPRKYYYLSDGRYCYMRDGNSGYGVYYLPSGATSLESEVLVQALSSADVGQWEASILYPQVVALSNSSCDTLNLYHPLDSSARTLFVDDSGYTDTPTGCTILWMEMGLDSGYTFTSDGRNSGKHIVQAYGDIPNQTGRYFTADDLGYPDYFVTPATFTQTKMVSDDGTRILLEVSNYLGSTYLVAEVTGTEEVTTTSTTTASADTTTTTTTASDDGYCATGCPDYYLADGYCDDACNVAACNYDNGDCGSSGSTTSSVPGSDTTGELGGDCYPNGTCNSGLICVYDTCLEASEGELGGDCYPNGTCDVGLTCVDNVCVTETCSASMILGEDDPRLETLRRFRDEILANSKAGKKIIALYYKKNEEMVEILDKHPGMKKAAKKVLEPLISAMELLFK